MAKKYENTQPSFDARRTSASLMRYDLERSEGSALAEEPRRALAVLRALDLGQNRNGARRLLRFAGAEPKRDRKTNRMVISRREVSAVAHALRGAGYPLDDRGISRFKEERGYSRQIRIHPEVADAYARMIQGPEARLDVEPEILRRLSTEARRALKLMLLIGRDPERLIEVRKVLDIERREPATADCIPVGKTSAKRLIDWANHYGLSFSDVGFQKLRKVLFEDLNPRQRVAIADLAAPVARWIVAADEPAHDYTQLIATMGAQPAVLNRRTLIMLAVAERHLGGQRLRVLRGSYDDQGDGMGAHPHQCGGAVDLGVGSGTREELVRAVAALRAAGFAAWYRPRPDNPHIHAIAVGDREMSAAAQWQIKSYFQGRDGRSRSNADPHLRLQVVLPHWVLKYSVRYR